MPTESWFLKLTLLPLSWDFILRLKKCPQRIPTHDKTKDKKRRQHLVVWDACTSNLTLNPNYRLTDDLEISLRTIHIWESEIGPLKRNLKRFYHYGRLLSWRLQLQDNSKKINWWTIECRSFRQRVISPTASSPAYEVVSPTSNVSSPALLCQFANVQNTFFRWK